MNMKFRRLLFLCCVTVLCKGVFAESDNDVKRGVAPYMAIIYYPDDTVVDPAGTRFLRSAVLIRPEWLLSAAIDHTVVDNVPLGFPRKTLLARTGAISIDANFTLNEDEDEQEREIIQIVRPSAHNRETWWLTDITLLKTLLPFKTSSAVAPATLNPKREYVEKNCIILVYMKKSSNTSEERVLVQQGVELLPPSIDNCGGQFSDTSMTCAVDSDDIKNTVYDPDFCVGNGGGPLLCENEVMALQTYIDNNCKQPHLYQLLSAWENFINCGTTSKCSTDPNCNICSVTNKDGISTVAPTPTGDTFTTVETNDTNTETLPPNIETSTPNGAQETVTATETGTGGDTATATGTDTVDDTDTTTGPTDVSDQTQITGHDHQPETETGQTDTGVTETNYDTSNKGEPTHTHTHRSGMTNSTLSDRESTKIKDARSTKLPWPMERTQDGRKMKAEDVTRNANMEAQLQSERATTTSPPLFYRRSSAGRNAFTFQSVFCSLILAYLI